MTSLATSVHPDQVSPTIERSSLLTAITVLAGLGAVTLAALGTAIAPADAGPGPGVRTALVVAWAVAGIANGVRGRVAVGLIAAGGALVAGVCASTATESGLEVPHAMALALLPAVALHLELAIPDGVLGTRTRRIGVIIAYCISVATGALIAATDSAVNAWAVAAAITFALLIGLPAANQRYLRSVGLARQRLQLIGCGVALVLEAVLVIGALRLLVGWPEAAGSAAAAATALVPLAVALGASPRFARRVDRVLVHTVSVTGLTAVVVAVYLVIVIGLGRSPSDTERHLLLLSMLAAAAASVVYLPARERLSELANRLVYGERHPPDEVLRTFGSRLSRAVPMDELLLQLAESLRKVMVLRRAEVWTTTGDRVELAVAVPDRRAEPLQIGAEERPVVARAGVSGNAWLEIWLPALLEGRESSQLRVAPACHSGEVLGLIVAERSAEADWFTDEDDRVLTELARQVGLALHNVQLDSALQESLEEVQRANEELRASRARIVATADAERRKIERNLHDGAQQHLVALAVNLRLAKDILGDDPESAAEMLDMLATSVKDTIQELRDLAHGIYPPLLMDSGLPEALRAAAGRSPLDVAVRADDVGRHPAEVEAAVYFCCLEALQNAAKHAPDASVVVQVTEDDALLRFEVSDDGPGFDPALATAGHGYVNMSDRLGAIGGSVEWRSAPGGGATVVGSVPVGAPAERA
jgi:signal transduction histidine kinase